MEDATRYYDVVRHIMREKIRLNKNGLVPTRVFLECELAREMRGEGYKTIFGLNIEEHEGLDILLE